MIRKIIHIDEEKCNGWQVVTISRDGRIID